MKFLFHYSVENFSNTYILGPDEGGDAILVDPGVMDVPLLELIEANGFFIKWVLITHGEQRHLRGLKTLKKIYDAQIYARDSRILDFDAQGVKPGNKFTLGEFLVEVFSFPEYSHDAVTYRIGNLYFCGDIVSAGLLGNTANTYARANLLGALEKRFYTMDEDLVLLPGEGPPSLLRSEKLFNVRQFERTDDDQTQDNPIEL